jgi:hypothetical protein
MKDEEESSDIGALWKEALEQHRKESKLKPDVERQMMQQMSWDVSSIIQEQNRQLELFSKARHPGTMLDKLRSAVGRNSAIIVGVANQVGNAASSVCDLSRSLLLVVQLSIVNDLLQAFPPAAAIVTAFTYVMKVNEDMHQLQRPDSDLFQASSDVSADLDKVAGFFDIMSSVLQKVSILEKKLPTVKAYKTVMTRVFSDLMILCGIATFYVANGRFSE